MFSVLSSLCANRTSFKGVANVFIIRSASSQDVVNTKCHQIVGPTMGYRHHRSPTCSRMPIPIHVNSFGVQTQPRRTPASMPNHKNPFSLDAWGFAIFFHMVLLAWTCESFPGTLNMEHGWHEYRGQFFRFFKCLVGTCNSERGN